ncbi:MAG: DUF2188 domain-containing protein [Candidatus Omnitrophota bacterium]
MSRNQHVVPYGDKWAVRKEGNTRITSSHITRRDAIHTANRIASSEASEVVIHGRDGRIRDKDSYGYDALPPRCRKY